GAVQLRAWREGRASLSRQPRRVRSLGGVASRGGWEGEDRPERAARRTEAVVGMALGTRALERGTRRLGIGVAVACLLACNKGDGSPSGPSTSRVARLTVTPADTSLRVGADMPLRVTAFNAAGQVLSNVPLTFRATADAIATVSS